MTERTDSVAALSRALDQVASTLEVVDAEARQRRTPCAEWTVGQLVDHLCADAVAFLQMMRGEQPDWAAPAPPVESEWAQLFRRRADEIRAAWSELGETEVPMGPDLQCAEFAVHTWDLAVALDRSTADLDPDVAQRGLVAMRANLTDDRRGSAFGPEQPVPPDADAYQRIAAFAGRAV
jgi:uncharacterized protein (TIGR03086 family)